MRPVSLALLAALAGCTVLPATGRFACAGPSDCPPGQGCQPDRLCGVTVDDAGSIGLGPPDGGPLDAGPGDAGRADAGSADGGDAGSEDAGLADAGAVDGGPSDAGLPDGCVTDACPWGQICEGGGCAVEILDGLTVSSPLSLYGSDGGPWWGDGGGPWSGGRGWSPGSGLLPGCGTLYGWVTVTNLGGQPVTVGDLALAVRPPGEGHDGGPGSFDLASSGPLTLSPGSFYQFDGYRSFWPGAPPGSWYAYVTVRLPDGGAPDDSARDFAFTLEDGGC